MNRRLILCVDTDPGRRHATTSALGGVGGFEVVEATTVEEAASLLETRSVDCVVTEHDLGGRDGVEVVAVVREAAPDTPCVLYTDAEPDEIDTTAFPTMVVEYLPRSTGDGRLADLVADLVRHHDQLGYVLPDDEDERIEALERYDLAELDVEDTFERLSTLVASHFDVSGAYVGLVEEHEENYVACYGVDLDAVPREDTICTHAIVQDEVFVVEDIQEDFRFRDNELLESLGIRSYAGANLETDDGNVVGSLCLVDEAPRTFDEAERADLQRFADEAMEQLELRRRLAAGPDDGGVDGLEREVLD